MYTLCFVPVVLGAKHGLRIEHLNLDHAIQFNCFMCAHTSIMPAGFFKKKFPKFTRIIDIEHQFQCSKCGSKVENYWSIVQQVQGQAPATPARAQDQRRKVGR